MALTGLCPAVGQGWLFFHPADEHAEGEEHAAEDLTSSKAEVSEVSDALMALGLSEASRASDFHWADTL